MTRQHTRRITCTALLLAALAPAPALAHTGHDVGQNLMAGLLHPLTGLDHLLMIIAVSAWAALLAPAGRIAVVACLALFVGIGALLPVSGGAALEGAIASTVVGAGILLAIGRQWPMWATGLLAAAFALVHGLAHGAEGPARSAAYIIGLVAATGTLALAVSHVASLLRRRLERAAALLRNEHRATSTITEIAMECGFNSATHFGQSFRRRYGMTPRRYRTREKLP